jgi:hypothetical protein
VFTVEQRDALREHLLQLAEKDERVVAGAAAGSLAVDAGDRFSDLDLTFAIADHVPTTEVLDAVRDHALSLACLCEGLPAVQARGYDDLRAETLARLDDAHVSAAEPGPLRAALSASVRALMPEGAAHLPHPNDIAQRLAELYDVR